MSESPPARIEDANPGDQVADRIRIRPPDFSVPSDDPFRNDLLDRKSAIEGLTRIIGSAQSPYVISVDAAWGSGKTAFLNMWCQHLEKEGFAVVQFNAWETDFADDPLQALSAEITQRLERFPDSAVKKGAAIVKLKAGKAVVAAAQSALRGTGALVPGGTIMVEAAISAFESRSEDPISDYQQTRSSLREFTNSIADVAETVSRLNEGKPMVVAIDELDRCRPTYAIELIETVKHVFAVQNVVFILAINSTALTHSAKSLYGTEFDAERYFRRFFDLQFRLPEPDRAEFVNVLLNSTKVQERIGTGEGYYGGTSMMVAKSLLSVHSLSLRDAEQAAHRLGLILRMADEAEPGMELCALVGLSIMVLQPETYPRFLRGEMVDEEVFEVLTTNLPFENSDLDSIKYEIEAVVIALNQSRKEQPIVDPYFVTSSLIDHHRKISKEDGTNEGTSEKDREYSRRVVRRFNDYWNFLHVRPGGSRLLEALRSLELVLPDQMRGSDSTSK